MKNTMQKVIDDSTILNAAIHESGSQFLKEKFNHLMVSIDALFEKIKEERE